MTISLVLPLIFILLPVNTNAHYGPLKKHLLLTIEKGPSWDSQKAEKEQKEISSHIWFIRKLRNEGTLRVLATESGHSQSFGILTLSDIKKAKKILNGNKAFLSGTFTYQLKPITIYFEADHTH